MARMKKALNAPATVVAIIRLGNAIVVADPR